MEAFWQTFLSIYSFEVKYITLKTSYSLFFSIVISIVLLVIRRFLLNKNCFQRALLFPLILLAFPVGHMKLWYHNRFIIKFSGLLYELTLDSTIPGTVYLCGIAIILLLSVWKRRRLRRYVVHLTEWKKDYKGIKILKNPLDVTPFTYGYIKPRIVIPVQMLDTYNEAELSCILEHEFTHIRLGHMYFYRMAGIIKAIHWINPFIHILVECFFQDLEEICDCVTIRKKKIDPYFYGQLLLQNIRKRPQAKGKIMTSPTPSFLHKKDFNILKRRITLVVKNMNYSKKNLIITIATTIFILFLGLVSIYKNSYPLYTKLNDVSLSNVNNYKLLARLEQEQYEENGMFFQEEGEMWVDMGLLEEELATRGIKEKNILVSWGSIMKLPGVGGGGDVALLEREEGTTGKVKLISFRKRGWEDAFWDFIMKYS